MTTKLALKVDVDTLKGYLEGVPAMLKLFKRFNITVSFCFSFGPDNSGKALRRIFRKGFIKKMLRTNAPGTYGLKTMMYGTLLPAPLIVPTNPDVFRKVFDDGHECGVHAWDHVAWQDTLDRMPEQTMRAQFAKACEMFESLAKQPPNCCAAPAWKVNSASLAMQDEFGFAYCSDTRGKYPFIPRIGGKTYKTPQIPSTLPTMDEIYGAPGITAQTVNDHLIDLLKPGLNVHTIHAEMEGGAQIHLLEDFIRKCLEKGVRFQTLENALTDTPPASLPVCDVVNAEIPGRAGAVAKQKTDIFTTEVTEVTEKT